MLMVTLAAHGGQALAQFGMVGMKRIDPFALSLSNLRAIVKLLEDSREPSDGGTQ